MMSDGVFYEAHILQNRSKIYTFDESGDARNLIKFTGVEDSQGNVIDEFYPFNNIDDLVSLVFYPGEARATDLSDCYHVLLEVRSNPSIRVLEQDMGKQGHEDYTDLRSFTGQHVAKHVTIEEGERMTVFGTVLQVYCSLLKPYGNDPVEKSVF
jgi:hypothetical protein